MRRHATATWHGSGKDGKGHLTTQRTVLSKTQYSFNSPFSDGAGTNPEELVAAAHAGCFTNEVKFLITTSFRNNNGTYIHTSVLFR